MGRSNKEDDKDSADSNNSGTKKKTGVVCCNHGKPCELANDRQHLHRNKATDKDMKSEREKRAYENDRQVNTARQGSSDSDVCLSRSATTADSDSSQNSLLGKVNPKEQLLEFYIGQCTPTSAEQLFSSKLPPLGFRLYHRIEEGPKLQAFLPLFIVHQRHEEFRHIRFLRCGKNSDRMRVDIEGEPEFQQLSQLVTFYDIYAPSDNDLEQFPKKQLASGEDD